MIIETDLEPDEFLEHYGTKGMKWGVRKERNTGQEIRDARSRHNARAAKIINSSAQKNRISMATNFISTAANIKLSDLDS